MINQVAVVTGGSRGIGREVAAKLAAGGYAVVVGYAGNDAAAREAVRHITEAGGIAIAAKADVADEAAVATLFETADREFGGVDVVVNAAGVMLLGPVAEFSLDDFDRMHRTNVRGAFVVSAEAARRVRDGGSIINFSSSVPKIAQPGYAAYAASKGAVDAMTLILAKEMRGRSVTVNAIAPGPTATALFLEGKDEATIARLSTLNPMERLGEPADIAELVVFLAGPGRWVNGQIVYANGGMV